MLKPRKPLKPLKPIVTLSNEDMTVNKVMIRVGLQLRNPMKFLSEIRPSYNLDQVLTLAGKYVQVCYKN